MQRIFGEPSSQWATPGYPSAGAGIQRLLGAFESRVCFTRFLPPDQPSGVWITYYEMWPFALDPANAPDVVWVGTGEANICGSGCVAGTGLYRSTNGGKSWTNLGRTEFQGKGIGAIVIKPGDPKTLYVGSTTALRGMSSVCCSGVTA